MTKMKMEKTDFSQKHLFLILTAAGSSSRMGTGKKKEYLSLNNGETVLSQSLINFLQTANFSHIIITIPKGEQVNAKNALFANPQNKSLLEKNNILFVEGSSTRQASIFNALNVLKKICIDEHISENPIVLIHDGARPFVSKKIIQDIIDATKEFGAAVPAIPPVDTLKEIAEDKSIKKHLLRKNLICVQTPQGFYFNEIFECHKNAQRLQKEFTDDTEIWDSFPEITNAKKVFVVQGDEKNIKITYPKDLQILKSQTEENKNSMNFSEIKIGFGTDLHILAEGRKFFLGGIQIPCEKGEVAHSDGDVLIHAICDALLGAAGIGDIGSYFPPTDDKWKNADSKILLKKVFADIKNLGWQINNLDCVVETEIPKVLPWRQKIISSLAQILELNENQIFVKAKTNEGQDAVGNKNAIKAYCSCLLKK